MIITRRYFNVVAATSAFMSSIAANRANALAWPTRPVHLVVPFAAGGPTDVIARIVGERLSKGWGWLVIFLLDVLILLTIAFVHLNRHTPRAASP